MELWKAKGSRSQIDRYRDVLLAEGGGKFDSGILRQAISKAVETVVLETQVGSGMHGGVCDVGHLMVRSLLALARQKSGSVAIIFVDFTRAFVRMRRRIAMPGDLES